MIIKMYNHTNMYMYFCMFDWSGKMEIYQGKVMEF